MDREVKWICPAADTGDVAPVFSRGFTLSGTVREASLTITALGVYEAELNGQRVGQFILTPGWTDYEHRLQYQTYNVTELLADHNRLTVLVGKG